MLDNEFKDDVVFARFINYMQITLLHKKIDYKRKYKVIDRAETKIDYYEWNKIQDKTDFIDSVSMLKDDYVKLKFAINKLTEKQRDVIENYYFKNKSLSKIAKVLNMNTNAVKQIKLRAILSLKRYMEDDENDEN